MNVPNDGMSVPADGPVPGDTVWPSVSVIIPALNEERHLEQAVQMILDQDYPGLLEIVLGGMQRVVSFGVRVDEIAKSGLEARDVDHVARRK